MMPLSSGVVFAVNVPPYYVFPPLCVPLPVLSPPLPPTFELTKFIRQLQLLNLLQGDRSCFPHCACEGWTVDYFYLDS